MVEITIRLQLYTAEPISEAQLQIQFSYTEKDKKVKLLF